MGILKTDNISGLGGRNAMKGSVYFSGYVEGSSADWLQIHDNLADFNVGTGDFTFECWVKVAKSDGLWAGIFGMYDYDNTAGILVQISNVGKLRLVNGTAIDQSGSTVLWGSDDGIGDWHHIAVARSGTTLKGFVNGVQEISLTYSNAIDFANGGSATIGITDRNDYPGDYDLEGYISNLRLIKGTALYTSNFTPSTEELKPIDGTVLLCCQDNDDPTAEATGRHEIVGFRKCYYGKRYSNIATNGDLETGATTGWTNNGCDTFEVSNNSHSGSYSLRCISNSNGDGVSYSVSLNTTLRYKISAYMKCVGPRGTSAKAKMKVGNAFGNSQNYESQTVGYDSYKSFDKWDYVEWIGMATYGTTIISFVESSSNNVNEWYVDDLRVELWYPEEDQNILPNPNFLTGATGWSFSSTPSGEYTISSNRLNVADTGRTSDAFATVQLFASSMQEGRYRATIDYAFGTGGFDVDIGNSRIWSITGTNSKTWELNAGSSNSSFRLVTGQTGAGYYNNVQLFRMAEPKRNNPVPPLGVDEGVTIADNTRFDTQTYMVPPKGATESRNRGRGLFFGGYAPSPNSLRNIIDYVQIQSQGNALDFGDLLTINNGEGGNCASSTRALAGGGMSNTTDITYVTIATTSNAKDFGDLLTGRRSLTAVSNDTRGFFAGGTTPTMKNEIEYVTIASKSTAQDFADLMEARRNIAPNSSPTRGVFAGGNPGSSPLFTNRIDYIEFATTGSQADFGDLMTAMREQGGSSSSTRGLIAGGWVSPANVNTIEYITIATTGAAQDYGDLDLAISGCSGTSNGTRGLIGGGSYVKNIQYVTISTFGNAQDFGDLTLGRMLYGATSDSHGGLS